MFFGGWDSIGRVIVVGTLAYIGIIVLLRASGNRTLSKMNSFDFVITVAFGSALATMLTSKQLSLSTGLVAIGLLILLQFLITWFSVRSHGFSKAVKTKPTLLVQDGRFLDAGLQSVRVTKDEVRSAVRQHGYGGLEQVAAVIMESDGSLSVIGCEQIGSGSALEGVNRNG